MSTEFGALDRGSLSASTSTRKGSMHTRALSFISSLRPNTPQRHRRTGSSLSSSIDGDPFAAFPCPLNQEASPSLLQPPKGLHYSRSLSHRRMRWSTAEDWQMQSGVANSIEADEFLGLAVTTVNCSMSCSPRKISLGKQKTQQSLRNYHRPTQINYEMWDIVTPQGQHHHHHQHSPSTPRQRMDSSSSSNSSSSGPFRPFQGSPEQWSPALLPTEDFPSSISKQSSLYSCEYSSSSSLCLDSAICGPHTPHCDELREVWRVCSTDEVPPMTFFK